MLKYWQELIILIVALVFTGIVSSFLLHVLNTGGFSDENAVKSHLLSAVVSQVVMFFGAGLLFFYITKIPFREYASIQFLKRADWWVLLACFFAAILLSLTISPLTFWLADIYADHPWVLYQAEVTSIQNTIIGSLRGWKMPIALFVFAVLPAIAEEFIFRGILYPIFKNITAQKQLSMWLTAFIFAVVHFQVLSFITILIVGFMLAVAYERTGNLTVAIGIHFGFNAIQIVFWQGA